MSAFVERLKAAAYRANTAGGWEDMELLLQPSRVLKIVAALEAAQELVSVKGLKECMENFVHTPECLAEPWTDCEQYKMEQDYARRKPSAWTAMRAALAALEEE